MSLQQYFNQSAFVAGGNYSSAAQLPNVAGSSTQTYGLQAWDVAFVNGVAWVCQTPTYGAAVWTLVKQMANPFKKLKIQTVSTSTGTIEPDTDVVMVTYAAGGCTLTLSTVAAGACIGTQHVIQKANTGANAITITPDSGSNINGGTTDANQTMVGLNNTASTTASSASTNDISCVIRRFTSVQWRTSAC